MFEDPTFRAARPTGDGQARADSLARITAISPLTWRTV